MNRFHQNHSNVVLHGTQKQNLCKKHLTKHQTRSIFKEGPAIPASHMVIREIAMITSDAQRHVLTWLRKGGYRLRRADRMVVSESTGEPICYTMCG